MSPSPNFKLTIVPQFSGDFLVATTTVFLSLSTKFICMGPLRGTSYIVWPTFTPTHTAFTNYTDNALSRHCDRALLPHVPLRSGVRRWSAPACCILHFVVSVVCILLIGLRVDVHVLWPSSFFDLKHWFWLMKLYQFSVKSNNPHLSYSDYENWKIWTTPLPLGLQFLQIDQSTAE